MAASRQGSAGAMRESTDDNGAAADRLGALLVERGKLSAAALERARRLHDETHEPIHVSPPASTYRSPAPPTIRPSRCWKTASAPSS